MDDDPEGRVVMVRLNAQQLELLDALVREEGFADRADALRHGLRQTVEALAQVRR